MNLNATSKVSSAHRAFQFFPPETGGYNTSLKKFLQMFYYTGKINLTPIYNISFVVVTLDSDIFFPMLVKLLEAFLIPMSGFLTLLHLQTVCPFRAIFSCSDKSREYSGCLARCFSTAD
jgi:hypothetical protein